MPHFQHIGFGQRRIPQKCSHCIDVIKGMVFSECFERFLARVKVLVVVPELLIMPLLQDLSYFYW